MMRMTRSFAAAFALLLPTLSAAQGVKTEVKKPSRPSIYDVQADAKRQVQEASAKAQRDGKRVLVMFGGDWCGWCHKLHELFASDPAIGEVLADEYLLVMVDTKAPNAESLLDECRGDLGAVGYPFLAVLDGNAKVVTRQKTDPLEVGDHHDPAKVKQFLDKWTAPKVSAAKLMEDALAKASSEDKLVFLHFGTPTCGWCHQLEAFLAREDMAAIFGRDFVDTKLDLARMTGADEVLLKYNSAKSGGVPWFAFLDAKGNAIINSDGPKGNIGYPATSEEIDHFLVMLNKVKRRIEPAQIEAIEKALRIKGQKIEDDMARRRSDPPAR